MTMWLLFGVSQSVSKGRKRIEEDDDHRRQIYLVHEWKKRHFDSVQRWIWKLLEHSIWRNFERKVKKFMQKNWKFSTYFNKENWRVKDGRPGKKFCEKTALSFCLTSQTLSVFSIFQEICVKINWHTNIYDFIPLKVKKKISM
jgi:hypothetical protein